MITTYKATLALALRAYPSLHVDENDVLDHLFFVTGNGYEWEKGALVDVDHETAAEVLAKADQQQRHFNKLLRAMKLPPYSSDPEVEREKERKRRLAEPHSKKIHPLSSWSHICCIPDDVRPDWLAAAQKALVLGRTMQFTASDTRWLNKAEARIKKLVALTAPPSSGRAFCARLTPRPVR